MEVTWLPGCPDGCRWADDVINLFFVHHLASQAHLPSALQGALHLPSFPVQNQRFFRSALLTHLPLLCWAACWK